MERQRGHLGSLAEGKQNDNTKKTMCAYFSNQPKCMDQVSLQNATLKGPHIPK